MGTRPTDGRAAMAAQSAGRTASHPYSSVTAAARPRSHLAPNVNNDRRPAREQLFARKAPPSPWKRVAQKEAALGRKERPHSPRTASGPPDRIARPPERLLKAAWARRLTARTNGRRTPPPTHATTDAPYHQVTKAPTTKPPQHRNKGAVVWVSAIQKQEGKQMHHGTCAPDGRPSSRHHPESDAREDERRWTRAGCGCQPLASAPACRAEGGQEQVCGGWRRRRRRRRRQRRQQQQRPTGDTNPPRGSGAQPSPAAHGADERASPTEIGRAHV